MGIANSKLDRTASDIDESILQEAAIFLKSTSGVTFLVEGEVVSFQKHNGRIRKINGEIEADCVVRLSSVAWDDLIHQQRTFINLFLSKEITFVLGSFETFAEWDPVLRYFYARIPPYNPKRVTLESKDTLAIFPDNAEDAVLVEQLKSLGYIHLRGVFTSEEMEAVNAEIDRLAKIAAPEDNKSWWVTAENGDKQLCRLVYASERSRVIRTLEQDPRVTRLGKLLDKSLRVAADRMEGTSVLLKVPGKTSGLSNIPWHQDCGMGGHSFMCPSVSVGIQLTGSDQQSGNLLVVPGSHGQGIHYRWQQIYQDVPIVNIDTEPGDVTVHIQDLLHASPEPMGKGGRRTMYVTFYPEALWKHIGPNQAFNDLVRNRTEEVAKLG